MRGKKKKFMIISIVILTAVIALVISISAAESDYNYGINVSGSTATVWFRSNVNTTWVDVHYIVNNQLQLNYRMTSVNGQFEHIINNVNNGDVIRFFFTYNNTSPAYDTPWYTYTVGTVVPTTNAYFATSTPDSNNTESTPPANSGGYSIVWSDEFNGTSLNMSNWTYDIGNGSGGWGNNELEYYTDSINNCRVSDGILTITARQESMGGMNYTSSRIKTEGERSWRYGRIEARIKLPVGQGLWPAFWMLGTSFNGSNWPGCGEIDILEHVNNSTSIHGTIHWDYNGYATYGGETPCDVTQFHNYAIEWNSSAIKWFVDGKQFHEANILNNINGTEEFHKSFFIILNLAVGGNWPGSPDANTQFPAEMKVDYIRVYQ